MQRLFAVHRRRRIANDLRGANRLAIDATKGVIGGVEQMHRTIASGPEVLGRPLEVPAQLWTEWAYGTIRGLTQRADGMIGKLAEWDFRETAGSGRSACPVRDGAKREQG